ncbi:MAG: SCO family protein [Solirubrobacteraceae bacterium]
MAASTKVQRVLMVLLVVLVGAIVFVLVGHRGSAQTPKPSRFAGPTMPPGVQAHNFTLRDVSGRRVTLSAYRGHVVVLTFIHSLCHDTCPFMVEQIKGALNLLPDNGRGVEAIGVSADPAEDTAARRRAFLARHEMTGRLAFVTGPEPVIRPIWHAYAVLPVTPKVDHSTFVILIDKHGLERIGFAADELTPEGLAHDIRVLQHEPS